MLTPDRAPRLAAVDPRPAFARLAAVSLGAVAALLDRHGALPVGVSRTAREVADVLGAAPRHRWLVAAWLRALAAAGHAHRLPAAGPDPAVAGPGPGAPGAPGPASSPGAAGPADRYAAAPGAAPAPPDLAGLAAAYAALGFPPEMAGLHRRVIDRLGPLLRDECQLAGILFADREPVAALATYQRNVFVDHLDRELARLARSAPATPGPLRVLEVGGGPGGTTAAVRAALADRPHTYLFTDVSRLFTAAAADRFPGLRTGLLDLDRPFADQGVPAGSVDVLIAGNSLHNAVDLAATLAQVRRVLAPGGRLLFTESTGANPVVLTSMSFLLSPPPGRDRRPRDPVRAPTGDLFCDAAGWRRLLAAAGFAVAADLPPADSPLAVAGQRLYHAEPAEPGPARGSGPADGRDRPARPRPDRPPGGVMTDLPAALSGARRVLLAGLPDSVAARAAALAADAAVDRAPGADPARLLAAVERSGADRVVLPAALLPALAAAPTLPLTDLGALTTVVALAPPTPAPPAVPAVPAVLGGVPVVLVAAPEPAAPTASYAALAAAAAAAGDAALAGLDLPAAVAALRELQAAGRASMLHTLRRCGVLAAPAPAAGIAAAAGVAPPYRALVGRWLDVLTSAGLVHRDGDLVAPADPAAPGPDWDALAARWRAAVGGDGTVAYARRNADALPDLLRGRGSPVEVLFPAGSLDTARALYRESVTARYQHAAVAAAVAALCADHPPGAVPRLLEIGTGTGATTDAVLPALAGRPVDYLLTDVSRAFLAPLLAARGDRVRGARYDIDAPPGPQGLAPGSFDVIIGGGVLNAARDTDASLRHLADLLAPGGHLVVSEPTTEEHWIMTSQALLLTPPADARAVDRTTFLTATRWRESYARAGLALVAALPPPGHPLAALGHHVHVLRTADPLTPASASSGHDLAAP